MTSLHLVGGAAPLWLWLAFAAVVAALLALDLGLLHRHNRAIGVGESLRLSAFYLCVGLAFGGVVHAVMGAAAAFSYWTAFLVEKSLAMDNLFIIAMIFGHMAIPRHLQHRVLFWGILGVIVLRGVMIGLGAAVVHQFEWVLYLFSAFLIVTGLRLMLVEEKEQAPEESAIRRFLARILRLSPSMRGDAFFVREPDAKTGRLVWAATPLFVALVMIEAADVVFAVDSIPAVFTVTTDPFLVYTSNIFAILGLRALYFALSAMVERFRYLKYALALLLIFIGSKLFVADLLGLQKFPQALSLSITVALLAGGVAYSLWRTRPGAPA